MHSRHVPMTIDAFHRLEWELGWKYEYWDGCAHISPREVTMDCFMPMAPRRAGSPPVQTEPVSPAHAEALLESYLAAFRDSVEYCDWTEDRLLENAKETIDGFFARRRGQPLAASRIIREVGATNVPLLGAFLVLQRRENVARVDLLFVVPTQQRQGLATGMATNALSTLHDMGFSVLESRYFLGNKASRTWHHRFGFADRPDPLSARILLAHARHELERHKLLGNKHPQQLSRLTREVSHWRTVVAQLDGLENGTTALQRMGATRKDSSRAP